MVFSQEHNEQTRCSELAKSSTFYRSLYSEIEEVGWELLVRLGGDLTFLSFRILDAKSRVHFVEIELDETYPKSPPRASADVPYIFDLKWSISSRLKDVVQQFQKHLEKLQEFWSTLDDIDKSLWVVDPKQPSRSMSHRQINIGNDCFIMLYIDADDPKSLPECRFMGPGPVVDSFRRIWQRNRRKWTKDRPYLENIACLLETQLPRPIDVQKNDQQVECGICYAQCLPMMSWEITVEAELTIDVIILLAIRLFIAFALGTGCVPSPQQGSHSMFYSGIVHTVQSQLL
ncbi:E3 ubiquitin-protein ligase FANCL isoform X4 [Carya illinoinensis]|uniref:E3 ubiquitin-protein ligase FANCL isoform X4 n=1 Tax=Carya illinoinensis TaxID=32201 RepID=UPI001C727D28|nr:E3 ubiquitin-protein ligase FANCL isoform X4 [Carya illinoinensis]